MIILNIKLFIKKIKIVDNENTLSNFLNKYNIHQNNANKNSCINNVTISNINKHHEKNMLFYKK